VQKNAENRLCKGNKKLKISLVEKIAFLTVVKHFA
jgi:hypothetical protein